MTISKIDHNWKQDIFKVEQIKDDKMSTGNLDMSDLKWHLSVACFLVYWRDGNCSFNLYLTG